MRGLDWSQCPAVESVPGKVTALGYFVIAACLWLFKSTKITERVLIAVRMEAFNVFNHANLGNPGSNVSAPATLGFSTARNGSRITQIGARVSF